MKQVKRINESQLKAIVAEATRKVIKEWDSSVYDNHPEFKKHTEDMAWNLHNLGLDNNDDMGTWNEKFNLQSNNDAEKRFYSEYPEDKNPKVAPNFWGNMALDEPTNVRNDHGQMGMLAQGDPDDPQTKFARAKRDTLRKSRHAEFNPSLEESRLRRIVAEATRKLLREMVDDDEELNDVEDFNEEDDWAGYWYEIVDKYGRSEPSDNYPTVEEALEAGISEAQNSGLPSNIEIGYWFTNPDGTHGGDFTGDGASVDENGNIVEGSFDFSEEEDY